MSPNPSISPRQASPIEVKNDKGEIQKIPQNVVRAFQIHQENLIASEVDGGELDINYYERNFPIGSLFSFTLQSTSAKLKPSDDEWDVAINPASFHVGQGSQLILNSTALDPSYSRSKGHLSLFVSTDVNPDYVCICPFLSRANPVQNLDVNVIGPAIVQFTLVDHHDYNIDGKQSNIDDWQFQSVNVFGKVKFCKPQTQQMVLKAKKDYLRIEEYTSVEESSSEETTIGEDGEARAKGNVQHEAERKAHVPKPPKSYLKKRKLSPDADRLITGEKTSEAALTEPKKLTKKQRKKLAKKKEKDLQEVIAKENNHKIEKERSKQNISKTESLTRKRMIEGGILVQDIIHGTGGTIRSGRKVAINYTGTFPDSGKVFDKNNSKSNPLTFRVGTGEVIKGLDRGLTGMKVGGERVITIPSELAYGKKGSGNIPSNATLCFTVQLKSVGGR